MFIGVISGMTKIDGPIGNRDGNDSIITVYRDRKLYD